MTKSIPVFLNQAQMIRTNLLWVHYLRVLQPLGFAARSVHRAVQFHLNLELRFSTLKSASSPFVQVASEMMIFQKNSTSYFL